MKDRSLHRKQITNQLLKHDSPEQVIEKLLEELARLQSELDMLNYYGPPNPITDANHKRAVIDAAIKKAEEKEKLLAEKLRQQGYGVWSH